MLTKLVLFDLDDTLFDHDTSRLTAFRTIHTGYEYFAPYAFDQFEHDFAVRLELLWPRVMDGTMSIETRIAEALRQLSIEYGFGLEEAQCGAMARHYRSIYLQSRQPIPGALPLLEALKPHATIGIITNNRVDEQIEKLKQLRLNPLIDFMICSGELGIAKPDPRIFEAGLQQAGCAPEEAVMIGDSWSADVVGAAAAGIRAVWLNRAQRPCPDPDMATEIHSLEPAEQIAKIIFASELG